MKRFLSTFCFLAILVLPASARQYGYGFGSGSGYGPAVRAVAEANARLALAASGADAMLDDDPAYARYKEGYNAILEEKWAEAKKRLEAVIAAFPKSDYRDDAEYWRAYALMHIDRKQAIAAYEKFMKEFPKSNYYDDAVSDLDRLNSGVFVVTSPSTSTSTSTSTTVYSGGDGYAYVYGNDDGDSSGTPVPSRLKARQLRSMARDLARMDRTMPHIASVPDMPHLRAMTLAPRAMGIYSLRQALRSDEKLDPDTQLKLDALYAIGDSKEDDKSFQALKSVALDTHADERLRSAALDMVSGFEKHDVLSIYTEIARTDTSEEMQGYAIDYISNNSKDKNKSVQTLIDLFNGTPKSRSEQKRRIFFSIAEVGNDRAVDFLASVAKTSDNYDLRREAVYYLGTMGSERARTALYDILQGSKER